MIENAMLYGRASMPLAPMVEYTPLSTDRTGSPSINTIYYFDQLIDHNNPTLGTFKQRYWMNHEFYQPNGPIILVTPMERNTADYLGYLTNTTINGMIAQQQQGAMVMFEHRFFGESNPYNNLASQSLEFLTIQQVIDDIVYFAQNAVLPMPGGDRVKPDATPWVLVGVSYGGALTSWTIHNKPGIFRAGYASSAVVQAIADFWAYFIPIQENMPQNCSSDVQAVITHLDELYSKNDTAAIQNLQKSFGLANISHVDDFVAALQLNLFDWQPLEPRSGPRALFYQFCDALEVKDRVNAPATGWGLENAIHAWDRFGRKDTMLCGTANAESCLGMYDPRRPLWTNVTVDNPARSWMWLACNEVGFHRGGPPLDPPAIVSRILTPVHFERFCTNFFPQKFSSPPSPAVDETNAKYAGWSVSVDRLFFANGRRDPWREATVSAEASHKANTTMQPIYESDGFHGSDMIALNGLVDETVHVVQTAALASMKAWLA